MQNWLKNKDIASFIIFSTVCVCSFSFTSKEIRELTWEELSDVVYKKKYSLKLKVRYNRAYPSTTINSLESQTVKISGVIIPMDTYGEDYILAHLNLGTAPCCHCTPKPHQILHLKLKNRPQNYELYDTLSFKGNFKISRTQILEPLYTLENATIANE